MYRTDSLDRQTTGCVASIARLVKDWTDTNDVVGHESNGCPHPRTTESEDWVSLNSLPWLMSGQPNNAITAKG